MKRVLILAQGEFGHSFLVRLFSSYALESHYDIAIYDMDVDIGDNPLGFSIYELDPTSELRFLSIFSRDHIQVSIVVDKKEDALEIYSLIRKHDKIIPINMLDFWNLELDDDYLIRVDPREIVANRFTSMLPDVPVVAQHIGLNEGEIMEIEVPIGSMYAYRHLLNIEQQKWKIAAIYRTNKMILPRPSLMLKPNDTVLAVGQPQILKNVYKAINSEVGQFPSPYGRSCYYVLDLSDKEKDDVSLELSNAISIHKRTNSLRLCIRIVNPSDASIVDWVRKTAIENESIDVFVAYRNFDRSYDYLKDMDEFATGLVIINNEFFDKKSNRKMLYESKRAIFKLGDKDFNHLEKVGLFLTQTQNLEPMSSPMFDFAAQISLDILLFNITSDLSENKDAIEHFENLSNIYEQKIEVIKKRGNPIREVLAYDDLLIFLPFGKDIVDSSIFDVLSTSNLSKHHKILSDFHQIFIPALEEQI